MTHERNFGFDSLKGWLIILVIAGHVIQGRISDNILREVIYFFHMPLFLAVTGYFVKKKTLDLSFYSVIKKYKHRMLLPYLIAFVFFTLLSLAQKWYDNSFGVKSIISLFLYPYYHLWYIPAVLLFIFYTKIITNKLQPSIQYVLIGFFLCLTIFFEGYGQNIYDNFIYKALGDKRFYCFYGYFLIGFLLKDNKLKNKITFGILIVTLLLGVFLYMTSISPVMKGLGKTVANLSLIVLTIECLKTTSFGFGVLAKIGMVSLPIYLWHLLPILMLKKTITDLYLYYLLASLLLMAFIVLILRMEGFSAMSDKLLYGSTGKK